MLTFAEFLSKRRAALGMSMTELAAHLSVTPQYISLLEAGKCNPSRKVQDRCARFFGEDIEYVRFLAQPMPREQKRVLMRTPTALPFLARRRDGVDESELPREPVQADGEDLFIQTLLEPIERGVSAEALPFYARLLQELFSKDGAKPRFSPKVRAWAEYYQAVLTARTEGIRAARPLFESLLHTLESQSDDPYPDVLRVNTAFYLAEGLSAEGEEERAGEAYERAAAFARLLEDAERALDAYEKAAAAYRNVGRPDRMIAMYAEATATEDIPAPVKAQLFMEQAELLANLGDPRAAFEAVSHAVRIWRLRSLNIDRKTAHLVSAQVLGLHILVELEERGEARRWLGRIRSTLARVTEDDIPQPMQQRVAALSDLESAAMMVQQGRWNHAWKNLEELEVRHANGEVPFDDPDEEILFRQRVLLLKTAISVNKRREGVARELLGALFELTPPTDPIRRVGRFTLGMSRAIRHLAELGSEDEARSRLEALLDSIDPDHQESPALRNLCSIPQVAELRDEIRGEAASTT